MADTSTRSLLPRDDYPKSHGTRPGRRDPYKLPFLILAFLVPLVGCIIASTVVLLTSDDDLLGNWSIRPSVLLSILASVYTILIGGLFATGVVVVWWRSIAHGTTLKRLHFIHAGASPKDTHQAIIAGGNARRVALAALCVFSLKLALGPILQRATKTVIEDVTDDFNITFSLAQNIPDGSFGSGPGIGANVIALATQTFLGENITLTTADGTFIDANGDRCSSGVKCTTRVAGAGLNFGCKNHTETIALLDPKSTNQTLFAINFEMVKNNDGLTTLYLETKSILDISDDCIGTITITECQIIPATVWYDVFISDSVIQPDWNAAYYDPQIIANATSQADDLASTNLTDVLGPLQALINALHIYYQSEAVMTEPTNGSSGFYVAKPGTQAFFWADLFKAPTPLTYSETSAQYRKCSWFWNSPTDFVMRRFIEFMFRSAIQVAEREPGHEQTVPVQAIGSKLKYRTDYGWFAVSIVLQILGIVAAMSLLWGFWQLDHYPTLSPLETSRAFGAPVLAAAGPEREVRSILEEVGHERVAYDGDELVWSGSVYATGAASSDRTKSSNGTRQPSMSEMDGGPLGHSSMRGRGHRRAMSSADASPSHTRHPSFEHSLGYTTRRPYDEEEMDLGRHGRARSSSQGSDRSPLIPTTPITSQSGSPKLPPIQRGESIRMEALNPPSGRMRRGSRSAADVAGMGKRPLSKIEERTTPEPDEGPRWR